MPNLGEKRRQARLVAVLANDACENSPWKLTQKMGYRPPAPVQAPPVVPQGTTGAGTTGAATTTPVTPVTPKAIAPVKPVKPVPIPKEPGKDVRTWVTPLDPATRVSERPPKPPLSVDPSDRKVEDANSSEALLGLLGLFILVGGITAVSWARFRRHDDTELAALLNPEGKLPNILDDQAVDLGKGTTTREDVLALGATGLGVGGARATATDGQTKEPGRWSRRKERKQQKKLQKHIGPVAPPESAGQGCAAASHARACCEARARREARA